MTAPIAMALMLAALDPQHARWTDLLQRYVHAGEVDYAGLKKDEGKLDAYLGELASVKRDEFDGLSRSAQLAFRINAYNAYAVRLILDHYPVGSIREIGFLPGAAFRSSFIPHLGASVSLDEVEAALRQASDPRIHFAIVCASKSCPELRAEAYRGTDLDRQLDDATQRFLRDRSKNRVEGGTLYLSSIFKWYRDDFTRAAGSLEAYVAGHGLRGDRIEFLDYDWSLNGK
jgi:hypothetical protein